LVYDYEGKPAWIWPHGQIPPSDLTTSADGGHRGVGVSFGFDISGAPATSATAAEQPAQRSVPPTRYSDVLGQNAAVEAARDLIELPLKHADLFLRIGAKPSGHGIILAGPPGTGWWLSCWFCSTASRLAASSSCSRPQTAGPRPSEGAYLAFLPRS
jgi:hypothetical protein